MNHRQANNIGEKDIYMWITKWEQEISAHGSMKDESEIYNFLKTIKEDESPNIYSQLVTLLARSRSNKKENNTLITKWLEKAISLDPNNQYAKEYLLKDKWLSYQNIFDNLSFPIFRETDNRTAKKKIVDEYLTICRSFLSSADEIHDELNKQCELIQNDDSRTLNKLKQVRTMFETMVDEVSNLLKVVTDLDESFSGVFYATVHLENLKLHLEAINTLKTNWSAFFNEDNSTTYEEKKALDQLKLMIGLDTVKERVKDFYSFLKYQKERSSFGYQTKDEISLNMILTGNPGTGKTTLARLLAKIYHELGVLPREEVIETNRAQLVGSFVGQTEENVQAIVKKAVGGVLFIDEAYSLKREGQSGNDYGQAAIDTLVSLMTSKEYGGKFAVILAGYPEEMRQFIDANTGLRSRFPQSNFIHLPNYSNVELISIAESIAQANDYLLTNEARVELADRLDKERVDETFGNARTVKNIVLEAIFRKGANGKEDNDSIIKYVLLEKEDFSSITDDQDENPNELLKNLIGLETVKKEMESLIAFVKVQKLRQENSLPIVPIQLHAVFSGNPGTGKTTVAKIYANFLKTYGILKRGHLIITSRSDFVAGYVGQTAIKTKKKIKEALGGVLFIDEAYSLLSPSGNDFGKEMIDTLVDEMTKHNENLVVILAGYPNEMEKLLESNPGLRSRFKKFFSFPDYSVEELVIMMEKYGERFHYQLTEEAKNFLYDTLRTMKIEGNGRFATNLIDEAIQAQSLRLVIETAENAHLLTPEIHIEKSDVEVALKKNRGE
ncbi:AAA family ATPase [Pseudoneobacillus rhizosphaerae]|uniref:Holliday junction ATP-dependent DNA helicase RuvB n=1 Tax=Pseudoneobacillus rhizosphaerae TaxID=2880968 RepID=A0A9C7G5V5_9BACI|nr:AAA family ATPase [Pseudoneobacillus rhizosphaerae]CAG9606414.1 Holliday junction ATP-dependent DNA helicase RuvB [Pseudoneobacillus rhizosphaerae]